MRDLVKSPYEPFDVNGKKIKVGDVVRVFGVPETTYWGPHLIKGSLPVFKYLVGKLYKVDSFDEYGCADIYFTIPHGRFRGMHSVAIEPHLLKLATWMNASNRFRNQIE